jgi:fucose permease
VHDTKERLSLFWLFALLNYLYADCTALFAIVGSPNLSDAPHFPPWVLLASSVFMEIPIAMIVASRLLPFRANRLANIIAGAVVTLINGGLTFVPPLVGARTPALPAYLFFATIETVCTLVIIWQAWIWSEVKPAVSSDRIVRQPEAGIASS